MEFRSLRLLTNQQDTTQYREILKSIEAKTSTKVVFIHDHHPVHRASAIQSWIRQHPKLEVLPVPTQSGDLNVMENVWKLLVKKVNEKYSPCNSPEKLQRAVFEVWNEIVNNERYIESLFDSIPFRLTSVIESRGDYF